MTPRARLHRWRGGGRGWRRAAPPLAGPAALLAGALLAATVPAARAADTGGQAPRSFASEPNATWGTSPSDDPSTSGSDRAGKVVAIAEAGDRVFFAGEFSGVMPPGQSTNKARQDPTPIVHRPYLA